MVQLTPDVLNLSIVGNRPALCMTVRADEMQDDDALFFFVMHGITRFERKAIGFPERTGGPTPDKTNNDGGK
jgi:hypothetical protein